MQLMNILQQLKSQNNIHLNLTHYADLNKQIYLNNCNIKYKYFLNNIETFIM